ncbi:hypothetical protein ScPMuIL_017104 [Solemya velum]
MGSGSSKNRKLSKDGPSESVKTTVKTIARFAKYNRSSKMEENEKVESENESQSVQNPPHCCGEKNYQICDYREVTPPGTLSNTNDCNGDTDTDARSSEIEVEQNPTVPSRGKMNNNTNECNGKTSPIKLSKPYYSNCDKEGIERRISLEQFVQRMKTEKELTYAELASKDIAPEQFRMRPETAKCEERFTRDTDKDLLTVFELDPNAPCAICAEPLHQFKEVGYPCRVCDRVFHLECLQQCNECHPADLITVARAHTNGGWSCYLCADLSSLLTPVEMKVMMDNFERCDLNRDSQVTVEEFLAYRSRLEGCTMTEDEKARFALEFQAADADGDGIQDWWEFVNHECKQVLARRPSEQLLGILTEKELAVAKARFNYYDENNDGKITEVEAKEAYRQWFKLLQRRERKISLGEKLNENAEIELHVERNARIIMDGDTHHDGSVSWDEFLADRALYIICQRPNRFGAHSRKSSLRR